MADAPTTKSTAAGGIGTIIADAVIAFNDVNVMYPLVTKKQCPPGSLTATFQDFTKIGSSSVTTPNEATNADSIALTITAKSATVIEHVINAEIGDLASMGAKDLNTVAGPILGNALAAAMDADLVGLFAGFSQTEVGATYALALADIFNAMRQLRAASAPGPYNLVMSPKGVWGSKGLRGLLVQGGNTGTNSVPHSLLGAQGQEMMSRGFVDTLGSIDIYMSPEIDEDVNAGGDAAAGMFSAGAIGVAVGPEGLFRIREQRQERARQTDLVAVGFWGKVEIKDTFGVYILHDVS